VASYRLALHSRLGRKQVPFASISSRQYNVFGLSLPCYPAMIESTLAGVHKRVRREANHFSPYHLLSIKTSPLLACEEALTASYKFSPCMSQSEMVCHDSYIDVSLQSTAVSCNINPASSICAGLIPKLIHFPMRVRTSESHLGLSTAVAGTSISDMSQLFLSRDISVVLFVCLMVCSEY
jgi:hypothetical protein